MTGYDCLLRTAWVAGQIVRPFSPKIGSTYSGRKGLAARLAHAVREWKTAPVWFHVASSGELEQCLPLVDELKRRRPAAKVLITYFSPTAKKAIELEKQRREAAGIAPSWDYADFAPFDFKADVERFVEIAKPQALVIVNREMWRHLVAACDHRKIPCLLFAVHFPEAALRARKWYEPSLARFKAIGTTDEASAKRLGRGAIAMGDPRIERVLMRRSLRPKTAWEDFFEQKPTWICASVWPKDFQALIPALTLALEEFATWRLVIVPHEPSPAFVEQLSGWFKSRKNAARLWSHWMYEPDDTSHLIVDKVGFLAELYRVAELTFVGGSFQARIHNVLEPAAYGKPILSGPFIQNSREAVEMNGSALQSAATPEELAFHAKIWLVDESKREEAGKKASEYLQKRSGSVKSYVDSLEKFLP